MALLGSIESGSLLTSEQNEVLIISIAKLVKGIISGKSPEVARKEEGKEKAAVIPSMEVEEKSSEHLDYNYKIQVNRQIVEAAQDGLVILAKYHSDLIFSLIIPKLLENVTPEELTNDPTPVMDALKALVLLSGASTGLFKSIMLSVMGLMYSNVSNLKFLETILETASNCISGVPSQGYGEV